MRVRELISKLDEYAIKYGDDIPVRTFDLGRDLCDICEVEYCINFDSQCYIYIGP